MKRKKTLIIIMRVKVMDVLSLGNQRQEDRRLRKVVVVDSLL